MDNQNETKPEGTTQPALGAVSGYADAVQRAATALSYRIHMTETEGIPNAEACRNGGVAAILRESVENDKKALAVINEALRPHTQQICGNDK
jgi:hypothetical protein